VFSMARAHSAAAAGLPDCGMNVKASSATPSYCQHYRRATVLALFSLYARLRHPRHPVRGASQAACQTLVFSPRIGLGWRSRKIEDCSKDLPADLSHADPAAD
jgi:hypothetical protein